MSSIQDSLGILIEKSRLSVDEECIGAGGFGKVYTATLQPENARVAFKQPLAEIANKRLKAKCVREIEQLVQLRHQNIIKVYGVTSGERFGIVMEYAEFGCLSDIQEDYEPLSWPLRIDFLRGITEGMCYLHSCSITHQDLKASNVLVSKDLQPKISDFGVSYWREAIKQSSQSQTPPSSTITHVAPERLGDINHMGDAMCDVYSYAILTWELITDKTPYFGSPADRIMKYVMSGGRPDLKLILKDCPEELCKIMMKCWFHDPDDRPKFTDIKEELLSYISSMENYLPDLRHDQLKVLEKAGLQAAMFPTVQSGCESCESHVETDSLPPHLNDQFNIPAVTESSMPVRSQPANTSSSQPANISCSKPESPTSNIPEFSPSKKSVPQKEMPFDEDILNIKGLNISRDLIKDAAVNGSHIQIGDHNVMSVSYGNKGTRSKKVIKIKLSDLTASTKVVSDDVYDYVSKHLGNKWRNVARQQLHFSDGEIDALSSDYRDDMTETIYQMLRKWRNRDGRNATLHNLAVALARAGKADMALHLSSYE